MFKLFGLLGKIISLAVIIIILVVSKNFIAELIAQKGLEAKTGLKSKMGTVDVGIKDTKIGIDNFKVYNPEGYKDDVMIDAPEIFLDYEIGSALKGNWHFSEVRLDIDEVQIIRNEKGELNLAALNTPDDFQIDQLLLKIGKVIYKDYSLPRPIEKEFHVGFYDTIEDINGSEELMRIIVQKSLMKSAFSKLTNLFK